LDKFKSIFSIILFSYGSLYSETVLLRNGNILSGKLKSQSINDLVIIIDSKEQRISKDRVFRVLYRDMSQTDAKKAMLAEIKKLNPKDREKLLAEINDKTIVSEIETKPNIDKPTKEDNLPSKETPTEVTKNVEPNSEKSKIELITKWGLVWRSALIPGWGHIRAKYYKTGIFYGTVFFGSALFSGYMSNQLYSSIEERDQKITTNTALTIGLGGPASAFLILAGGATSTEQDEQRILGYRALLYSSLGVMTGIYIIQLINVYVLANYDIGDDVKIGVVLGEIVRIRPLMTSIAGKDKQGDFDGGLHHIPNSKFITETVERQEIKNNNYRRVTLQALYSNEFFVEEFSSWLTNLKKYLDETLVKRSLKDVGNYKSYVGIKYKLHYDYDDDGNIVISISFIARTKNAALRKEEIIEYIESTRRPFTK
jgi:hypothetical protein